MFPALNIRCSIGACVVADGEIDDLEIQQRSPKKKIEIPERVELP